MRAETVEASEQTGKDLRVRVTDRQSALLRLIRVWDHEGDEVRSATLLNVALLLGLASALIALGGLSALTTGVAFHKVPPALMTLGLAAAGWHAFCTVLNKRGAFRFCVVAYPIVVYVLIALAILATGGARSHFWVGYLWPIVILSVFLSKRAMPVYVLAVLALWFSVVMMEHLGYYHPVLWMVSEVPAMGASIVVLILLVMVGLFLGSVSQTHLSRTAVLERSVAAHELRHETLVSKLQASSAEVNRLSLQLSILQELNRINANTADVKDLLQQVGRLLSNALGAYHVLVFLTDETGERLVQEMSLQEFPSLIQLRVGEEGIVGHAAATGQSYVTSDVASDPYYRYFPGLSSSVSAAAIPMMVEGRTLGILALESEAPDTFSEQTVELLEAVANVLGTAVMNARTRSQYNDLSERLKRYEVQESANEWRQVLERRQGRIALLYDRMAVRPISIEEGETLFVGSESTDIEIGIRADGSHVIQAPLRVGEQLFGRMMFESDVPWQDDQRVLVETVAGQLGLALENARLLEATRRSAAMEQTAADVTSRFRKQVEIEGVLQQALADLAQVLDAERAVVRLEPTWGEEAHT